MADVTTVYAELAKSIIKAQENLIGPVAVQQALTVAGLEVKWEDGQSVSLPSNNGSKVIDDLVKKYKQLFGQISVEVCKEAVGRLSQQLSPEQMPASLR